MNQHFTNMQMILHKHAVSTLEAITSYREFRQVCEERIAAGSERGMYQNNINRYNRRISELQVDYAQTMEQLMKPFTKDLIL
jgi:hypothetical protein